MNNFPNTFFTVKECSRIDMGAWGLNLKLYVGTDSVFFVSLTRCIFQN